MMRVYLKSVPGPYAQYDGYVDVPEPDNGDPFLAAVNKLRRTSFPDRRVDMWICEKIEVLFQP